MARKYSEHTFQFQKDLRGGAKRNLHETEAPLPPSPKLCP